MSRFNINFASLSESQALQGARNYRGGKNQLQYSIAWAVKQALAGNADGVTAVFQEAQLISKRDGEMTALADGRAVWKYLTTPQDRDGLGLGDVVRWDSKANKFKMAANWSDNADKLDMGAIILTLSSTRWDEFQAKSAERAFDLEKAIKSLVTRAANQGVSEDEIVKAFDKLRAA
jgi:hypothetical protein